MEILNIVLNHHPSYKGYIRFTLDTEVIDGKEYYVVKCMDNGIGWTLENMPLKNWLRYQRSKAIVESLGGTIEYYAKPKEGSLTIIKIPSDKISLEEMKEIFRLLAKKALEKNAEIKKQIK